jgi:sugar phosphate isomerase/epimerase
MIRSSVTVSLVEEARQGPFVFHGNLPGACRSAAELGFDAIELFPPSPDAVAPAELHRMLSDHGLSLAAVGTGAGWVRHKLHLTSSDAAVRARAGDYIRSIIDFAAPFGAPAIIGSMQGRAENGVHRATALAWLSEALEQLGSHAARHGTSLIFEPINRYETNLINTIGAGVELLQPLETKNVRLLADLFHMNIEEVDLAAAIRAGGRFIGHVHFVDSNRRPAGFGHLNYSTVAAALAEIGYSGYASAEALPYPDSLAAATQTIEAFQRHFRREAI